MSSYLVDVSDLPYVNENSVVMVKHEFKGSYLEKSEDSEVSGSTFSTLAIVRNSPGNRAARVFGESTITQSFLSRDSAVYEFTCR